MACDSGTSMNCLRPVTGALWQPATATVAASKKRTRNRCMISVSWQGKRISLRVGGALASGEHPVVTGVPMPVNKS